MSNVQEAYNAWSSIYDANKNRTRDLEAVSLRETVADLKVNSCLEIGCGTGKNSVYLSSKVQKLSAVDFSENMLAKARQKLTDHQIEFIKADITGNWDFLSQTYDLITFSLVLEHIEHLNDVLLKAANALRKGGFVYIGELHPFKQYTGTKARFETSKGVQEVTCFNHHVSDFTEAATQAGLQLVSIKEYFDENDRSGLPRILTFLLSNQ